MEIKYDNTQFDAFLFADDRTVTFFMVTNLLEKIGHVTMKRKYQKSIILLMLDLKLQGHKMCVCVCVCVCACARARAYVCVHIRT